MKIIATMTAQGVAELAMVNVKGFAGTGLAEGVEFAPT